MWFVDECSSTISQTTGELYPQCQLNLNNRGHSRQASKSSVSSNYSTMSNNSISYANLPVRWVIHRCSQLTSLDLIWFDLIRNVITNESRQLDVNLLSDHTR